MQEAFYVAKLCHINIMHKTRHIKNDQRTEQLSRSSKLKTAITSHELRYSLVVESENCWPEHFAKMQNTLICTPQRVAENLSASILEIQRAAG